MKTLALFIGLIFISTINCDTLVSLSSQCISDFRSSILAAHNSYRVKHKAQALVYNSTIGDTALKYANYLGINNLFQHSGASGLGENLAFSWSSNAPDLTKCSTFGTSFAQMWYNEIKDYSFANPGFSSATGHFTAVVWLSTSQLGCGLSVTTGNKVYGVCNYYKAGNVLGQFATNVLPPV